MKPYPTITSYKQAVDEPASYATLEGIKIFRKGRDLHFASGNFATVFKAEQQGKQHALKCFLSSREDREERYRAIARYLKGIDSPYFVSYKYLTNELWVDDAEYPVVWMEWVEGQTLGAYLKDLCAAQDTSKIRALAEKFKELALWLLDQELAHGDLKHDNILVKPTGDLVLVDYDGMYVPVLVGRTSGETGGKGYQHPLRSSKDFHTHLDDFSILIIYVTLLALEKDPALLSKYEAGDNLIISVADLENWEDAAITAELRRLGLEIWVDRVAESLQQPHIRIPRLVEWLCFSDVNTQLQKFQQELEQHRQDSIALRQQLEDCRQMRNTFESQLGQVRQELDQNLKQRTAVQEKLQTQLNTHKATSQALEQRLAKQQEENQSLRQQLQERNTAYAKLQRQLQECQQVHQKTKKDLQILLEAEQQKCKTLGKQLEDQKKCHQEELTKVKQEANAARRRWLAAAIFSMALVVSMVSWSVLQPTISVDDIKQHIATAIPLYKPSSRTVMLSGEIPMEFIRVDKGEFKMGGIAQRDQMPIHTVRLTQDFYMGQYPVTQNQWKSVMGTNPSYFRNKDNPVENVSWEMAQAFIQRLNRLYKGKGRFALPTEAQWEYAARGGTDSQSYTYAGTNNKMNIWHLDNSKGRTRPVNKGFPNDLGLCDMSGNVFEWCSDWAGAYPKNTTENPVGPTRGKKRIMRGGSFRSYDRTCGVAYRHAIAPVEKHNFVGFRVVFYPAEAKGK